MSAWVRGQGQHLTAIPPNFVVNPALYNKVPYDPYKDFDPVTIAVTAPPVLTVHPSVPAQTVRDLVGFIKSSPGKYNFASGGTGTPGHLVGEQFRLSLGLDLVHVPFNSAGLAVGATVAGQARCDRRHYPTCQQWRKLGIQTSRARHGLP